MRLRPLLFFILIPSIFCASIDIIYVPPYGIVGHPFDVIVKPKQDFVSNSVYWYICTWLKYNGTVVDGYCTEPKTRLDEKYKFRLTARGQGIYQIEAILVKVVKGNIYSVAKDSKNIEVYVADIKELEEKINNTEKKTLNIWSYIKSHEKQWAKDTSGVSEWFVIRKIQEAMNNIKGWILRQIETLKSWILDLLKPIYNRLRILEQKVKELEEENKLLKVEIETIIKTISKDPEKLLVDAYTKYLISKAEKEGKDEISGELKVENKTYYISCYKLHNRWYCYRFI